MSVKAFPSESISLQFKKPDEKILTDLERLIIDAIPVDKGANSDVSLPRVHQPVSSKGNFKETICKVRKFLVGLKQQFPYFDILWKNYPRGQNARPSRDNYKNQCTIRVGYALQESGFDIADYPKKNQTSEGYPRSSQGLADWLWHEVGPPLRMSQEDFEKNYGDRTGLIYQAPIPGEVGHIDLYNKSKHTTGSGYFKASEIWFWPIETTPKKPTNKK